MASSPPNQPLLAHLWLALQWEAPNLAHHLQQAGGVSMLLNRMMLSLLATVASPAATVRLVELALWETPPVPRCHAPLLLCALVRSRA